MNKPGILENPEIPETKKNPRALSERISNDFKTIKFGYLELENSNYASANIRISDGREIQITFDFSKPIDDGVFYIRINQRNPFDKPSFKTLKSYDSLKSFLCGMLNVHVPLSGFKNNRDYLVDARRRVITMLEHSKALFSGHQVMLPISDLDDHWDMQFKTFKMTLCLDYLHPNIVRFKVNDEIIDGWDNLEAKFKELDVLRESKD